MAAKKRRTPQGKVSIPEGDWPDVREAMEWDGIKNFSQFALAAIRQRVRRVLREKAADETDTKPRA
jgi:hypothetical protein